jgi:hypothetical protein
MLSVYPPFELLKKLTDFHDILCGPYALRGDPNLVLSNFMVLIHKKEYELCHNYRVMAGMKFII